MIVEQTGFLHFCPTRSEVCPHGFVVICAHRGQLDKDEDET